MADDNIIYELMINMSIEDIVTFSGTNKLAYSVANTQHFLSKKSLKDLDIELHGSLIEVKTQYDKLLKIIKGPEDSYFDDNILKIVEDYPKFMRDNVNMIIDAIKSIEKYCLNKPRIIFLTEKDDATYSEESNKLNIGIIVKNKSIIYILIILAMYAYNEDVIYQFLHIIVNMLFITKKLTVIDLIKSYDRLFEFIDFSLDEKFITTLSYNATTDKKVQNEITIIKDITSVNTIYNISRIEDDIFKYD